MCVCVCVCVNHFTRAESDRSSIFKKIIKIEFIFLLPRPVAIAKFKSSVGSSCKNIGDQARSGRPNVVGGF